MTPPTAESVGPVQSSLTCREWSESPCSRASLHRPRNPSVRALRPGSELQDRGAKRGERRSSVASCEISGLAWSGRGNKKKMRGRCSETFGSGSSSARRRFTCFPAYIRNGRWLPQQVVTTSAHMA
ncbi:hypothetical protein NL676_017887 [Syzygium grande]|nr:hypothetical protein NL676_017887 [Syzygium grande]